MKETFRINLTFSNDIKVQAEFSTNNNIVLFVGKNRTYKTLLKKLIATTYEVLEQSKKITEHEQLKTFVKDKYICIIQRGLINKGSVFYTSEKELFVLFDEAKVVNCVIMRPAEAESYSTTYIGPYDFTQIDVIKDLLIANEDKLYKILNERFGSKVFLENIDSFMSPNNIVKFVKLIYRLSDNRKIYIETLSDYTLEALNMLIQETNLKVDVLVPKTKDKRTIFEHYEANKDNLIDTSLYTDVYVDILRKAYGFSETERL